MAQPSGDPLGKRQGHGLLASPRLELLRDFDGTATEPCVAGGACAAIEVVSFHPGVNESQRVANAELTWTVLFDETLADEVLDDARHESRTGLGASNQILLGPDPVPISEQTPNDSGAHPHEHVSRFQLESEVSAWQRATVHEHACGADVSPAINIERARRRL